MDLARYAELFLSESRELLSAINRALLELERAPESRQPIDELFRAVHTIKGMSATMGYAPVADLSHGMETLLDRVRAGTVPVTPDLVDVLCRAVDSLDGAIEGSVGGRAAVDVAPALEALGKVSGDKAADAAAGPGRRGPRKGRRKTDAPPPEPTIEAIPIADPRHVSRRGTDVRIGVERLDVLLDLIGELVITRGRLADTAAEIMNPALDERVVEISRLIGELQTQIMTSRLVPVTEVFERFPRLVRDAARSVGKEITFTVEGEGIEVDRSLLDGLGEPIVHLLRNSVDHGIEAPEARVAAGKPKVGRISLTASRDRDTVAIQVRDDGRGVDRERVLEVARRAGVTVPDASHIGDDELLRLLALPGLSTAGQVSALSGRGVGLDAVVARLRSLGGSLVMHTEPGRGTSMTVRLPATIAIVRAVLARVGDETYALPAAHVAETMELDATAVQKHGANGEEVLMLRDGALPLLRLRDVVHLTHAPAAYPQVAIVQIADRRAGLVVDELLEQQEIVVKPFDAVDGMLPLFSGATILGDGTPALIMDVGSISLERSWTTSAR